MDRRTASLEDPEHCRVQITAAISLSVPKHHLPAPEIPSSVPKRRSPDLRSERTQKLLELWPDGNIVGNALVETQRHQGVEGRAPARRQVTRCKSDNQKNPGRDEQWHSLQTMDVRQEADEHAVHHDGNQQTN
jgi:hypothetical protein